MKKLGLHNQTDCHFVSLPVDFIDLYMPEASGDAIKVYLYLLRASQDPSIILSLPDMVDLFDVTQNKIREALLYWEGRKLLSLSYAEGEISDITLLPLPKESAEDLSLKLSSSLQEKPEPVVAEQASYTPEKPRSRNVPSTRENPLSVDLTALYQDENFSELSSLSEAYLGRPLTATEANKLASCYLMLDQNPEITEYLVEHCIDTGHSSFHYIEAVAKSWHESGFRTLEEVKNNSQLRNENVYKILKSLGIKRDPVSYEEDFINAWTKNFDLSIILEACNRTMQNTHTADFNYANAILNSWKNNQVRTLSDIEALDKAHAEKSKRTAEKPASRNGFKNASERNTDYDKLFASYS